MKIVTTALALSLTAFGAGASTVQLDWTSGSYYDASVDISTISSIYNAWPTNAVALYLQDGFEVLQFADQPYDPFNPPGYGPGFIASNDPGIDSPSVRDVIARADGRTFSLASLETWVNANQIYFEYQYGAPGDSLFPETYVESSSFDVTVTGDAGSVGVDPFSGNYVDSGRDKVQERSLKTTTGFGGIASNTGALSISSAFRNQSPCDPSVLMQAGPLFAANLDCTLAGPTVLADGTQLDVYPIFDLGNQNWDWAFSYAPTLTVDMVAAVPLPGGAWSLLLAFGGLAGVKRIRSA